MHDDDTEPPQERPSLAAPHLFGRRRAAAAPPPEPAFEDSGVDLPTVPVTTPAGPPDDDDSTVVEGSPVVRKGRRRRLGTDPAAEASDTSDASAAADTVAPAAPRRRRPKPTMPVVPDRAAATLSGFVSGLSLVGFVWIGFRGCELVRGTSSCGTAPGMAALVVVFVLAVVVGGFALRLFKISEAGVIAFLGVGLTCVVALIALVEVLDSWTMVVVIPAITAATFLASWWLSTTYIDQD